MAVVSPIEPAPSGRRRLRLSNPATLEPLGEIELHNDADVSQLTNQTYCSLLAFGLLPEGMKNLKCSDVERCMPGEGDCKWLKLPDALCPADATQADLFGCHLGAEGNQAGARNWMSR